MSSGQMIMPSDDGSYHYGDLNTSGGDYSSTSRRHSTQPDEKHLQRHQQTGLSVNERQIVSLPVKLNFSRPFSKPVPQYRQYYHTADNQEFDVLAETTRVNHNMVIQNTPAMTPVAQNTSKLNEDQMSAANNASTVPIDYDPTRPSTAVSRRKDELRNISVTHQIDAADSEPKESCEEVHTREVTVDTCHTTVDENQRLPSDGCDRKRRHQNQQRRSRSSSSSSSTSSSSDSSSRDNTPGKRLNLANKCREPDAPTHREVQHEPEEMCATSQKSDHIVAAVTTKPTGRNLRTNQSTSTRKATQAIGSIMRRTDRGVIMEDDNIVVQHDSYSVVYKDTNKVFTSVQAHMKTALEDLKKSITSICEAKLEAFRVNVDRVVKLETNKLRQSVSRSCGKPEDNHRYVIFTPKSPPECEVFHIVTAADRDELNKKFGRCKNVEKLVLTFVNTETFGVGRMRDVFKENGMTLKAKNDFTFPGVDMKDLQSYLVKIFNVSISGSIDRNDYRISYISGERSSSITVATSSSSRKRKPTKSKDAVQRSRNEEYTDMSGEDEPADERIENNGDVALDGVALDENEYDDQEREEAIEDRNRYNSSVENEVAGENNSSSDREINDHRLVAKRLSEHKRKHSRTDTITYNYSERDEDARNDQRSSKKKRSRRD